MHHEVITGDCLDILKAMPDKSVDLVFTSPPYGSARTYGIGFKGKGEEFVDWCLQRYVECHRVSRGLTAWVLEGQTKGFQWTATPALLMADLHRRGIKLRKPPAFHRVGIPGSGGPDFLRNDWEMIVCSSHGKLLWSNNVACGHPPKWAPGGAMSNRKANGDRVAPDSSYAPPKLANPGNFLHFDVGGGRMGHDMAHENEAAFPLGLAEFFVKSFCPPGGTVLDCFGGSGTTSHAAEINGRNSISIDIREDQSELTRRRLATLTTSRGRGADTWLRK